MLGYTFIPSVDNGDFYASFEFRLDTMPT